MEVLTNYHVNETTIPGGCSYKFTVDNNDNTGGFEEFEEITDGEYARFKEQQQKKMVRHDSKTTQKLLEVLVSTTKVRDGDYDNVVQRLKGIIILDTCDACLINHCKAVDLILASEFGYYDAVLRFAVNCRLMMNLKYFEDEPEEEQKGDSLYFQTGGVEAIDDERAKKISVLSIDAVQQFNRYSKDTTLRFVSTLKCNYSFGYLSRFFLTISAMDELSGEIGTYQIALALRMRTLIVGLVRNMDTDKVLGVLSIEGAEGIVRDELKAVASKLVPYGAVPAEVELNAGSRADKIKMA